MMPWTYAFPIVASDYIYTYETSQNFAPLTEAMKQAALSAFDAINSFTNLNLTEGDSSSATIRLAQSDAPATAYAYLPGDYDQASDIWFGRNFDYTAPHPGNYAWHTIWHEIGHALGLDHMNDLALEQSIMSYRTYEGGRIGAYSYTGRSGPQTFMPSDIAALQDMYGVNHSFNSGDTVYRWNPSDRKIFETVWDGEGTDTYDLSNYRTNLRIDLRPGESSVLDRDQLANLGHSHRASGNIYNAFDMLIENAIGGRGNDRFRGNEADNTFTGGLGRDVFVFRDSDDGHDIVTDFTVGTDRIVISVEPVQIGNDAVYTIHSDYTVTLLNVYPDATD